MHELFADPRSPLLDQAVLRHLDPLPLDAVAEYVSRRFALGDRDVGTALTPLLELTRGHPQRSMMLAHYLWQRTPRGGSATDETWLSALDRAAQDSAPVMNAIWRAPTPNERRVARAITVVHGPLYSQETAAAVGIRRTSIRRAFESLLAQADVISDPEPRLTDPMFEHWLQTRGLTPVGADGEEDPDEREHGGL